MANMNAFNEATARILAKLYEGFPRRVSLKVGDLVGSPDQNKEQTYGDTIIFLEREGFLRYETRVGNEHYNDVSLTAKGLAILNSVPASLQEKEPLGCRLTSVLKDGSKELIRTIVEQIIKGAMGVA